MNSGQVETSAKSAELGKLYNPLNPSSVRQAFCMGQGRLETINVATGAGAVKACKRQTPSPLRGERVGVRGGFVD